MTRLNAIEMGHARSSWSLRTVSSVRQESGNVAKLLADQTTSVLLDLPNHGRCHGPTASFRPFADLVADELRPRHAGSPDHPRWSLDGRQVAMRLALRHPELLSRFVAPICRRSPSAMTISSTHRLISLDLDRLGSRGDADNALAEKIPNTAVRAFKPEPAPRHVGRRLAVAANLGLLQSVEADRLATHQRSVDGPVLWLRGENSDHVQPGDEARRGLLPRCRCHHSDAGHGCTPISPAVAQAMANSSAEASPVISPRRSIRRGIL